MRLVDRRGHVTTENVIGNSFLSLKEFPHILPRLLENKALLPDFIEEVIRLRPSIQRVTRYTAVESEIGGKRFLGEKCMRGLDRRTEMKRSLKMPIRLTWDESRISICHSVRAAIIV